MRYYILKLQNNMFRKIIGALFLSYFFCTYAQTGEECARITSPSLRLACFDKIFNTPATKSESPTIEVSNIFSKNVSRIFELENTDNKEGDDFIVSHRGETIKIALKSQSNDAFSPVMFWGCIDNITHFQVALKKPITDNKVLVSVEDTDVRKKLFANEWQVLEHGHLLDIGRGLFAIEKIKKMLKTKHIVYQVSPLKYRWHFTIENLDKHIKPLRESCGW